MAKRRDCGDAPDGKGMGKGWAALKEGRRVHHGDSAQSVRARHTVQARNSSAAIFFFFFSGSLLHLVCAQFVHIMLYLEL